MRAVVLLLHCGSVAFELHYWGRVNEWISRSEVPDMVPASLEAAESFCSLLPEGPSAAASLQR